MPAPSYALEPEQIWQGRVMFLEGKDGMWVVDHTWVVMQAYPDWTAVDLRAGEHATVERAVVGTPRRTLFDKIVELIGDPW